MNKITILTVTDYGDFDPCSINLCTGESELIHRIKNILNIFCKSLPECGQDIPLSQGLDNEKYLEELKTLLLANGFTQQQMTEFINLLKDICTNDGVIIGENIFETEEIVQI